tara:strand:- start:321 stop:524 length:204 start_codon:yes stop_codon:yes gene_type:complete
MNTFRDKHFKNELIPKTAYYECIRSCEINKSKKKGLKNCFIKCEIPLSASQGYQYLKANIYKRDDKS